MSPVECVTLFRLRASDDWLGRVQRAIGSIGLSCQRRGGSLCAWGSEHTRRSSDSILEADGCSVFLEWVGSSRQGLAVAPRRLYFEDGSDVPSERPERELVALDKRNRPPPDSRLRGCLNLAQQLARHIPGLDPNPWPVSRVRRDIQKKTSIFLGQETEAPAGASAASALAKNGFLDIPADFRITLVTDGEWSRPLAEYTAELENALHRCRAMAEIRSDNVQRLATRLGEYERGAVKRRMGRVLLFAVKGRRGQTLPPKIEEAMVRAERLGIPYRLFSEDNESLRWSAFDQLPSLVQAAGGVPYALRLPWPEAVTPPFVLGVDLGHPLARRESWVAMSMLDHRGAHLCSWRCRQERDETVRSKVLAAGLKWAKERMDEFDAAKSRGVLAVRDGRLHEGERIESYRAGLGRDLTFVEFTKRQNPEMFVAGASPSPAPGGTEVCLEGAVTPFIAPVSPRLKGDLTRVFKVHMRPGADGLGLGMDAVVDVLTGLSYSPGLGLQPHALPGPIYWADGIAAIGPTNHQFSGQKITECTSPCREPGCEARRE